MKSLFTYITIISVWLGISIVHGAAPPKVYAQLQAASVEILVNGRLAGSGSVVDTQGHVLIANHMAPGDGVRIEESRPMSKMKRWKVLENLQQGEKSI